MDLPHAPTPMRSCNVTRFCSACGRTEYLVGNGMRYVIGKAAHWDPDGPVPRVVAPACRLPRHVTFRAQRSIQRGRFMEYTTTPPPSLDRTGFHDATARLMCARSNETPRRPFHGDSARRPSGRLAVRPGFESCNVTRFRYLTVTATPGHEGANWRPCARAVQGLDPVTLHARQVAPGTKYPSAVQSPGQF